jgi:hypothetical protein
VDGCWLAPTKVRKKEMPGVSIDTFGASMIKYLPGVRQTLNKTSNMRRIAKAKQKKWQGESMDFSVHVARNHAIGNIEDGGAFPAAGKQSYVFAKVYRKFTVGSVQLTDGILKNAATTEGATISVTESELDGMIEGIKKYENYFFTRDGTGEVTKLGATASGATITVEDARLLWSGKSFEIRDATTTTTIHDTFKVTSVARALTAAGEATVTLDSTLAASGQADGDLIVWGTGNNSSWGRTITGLDALIDDASTTFQNVNTTTYPRYTSPVLSANANRSLTPQLFKQMLAMIKQESGDDTPNGMTVVSNTWQNASIEELYEGELRMRPDDKVGGFAVSKFQTTLGTINLVVDPDAPYNKFFFLDPSELCFAVQADLDWRRDGPGGSIFKRNDSSAVYTATALEACELAIFTRNKFGKIENISEDLKASAY